MLPQILGDYMMNKYMKYGDIHARPAISVVDRILNDVDAWEESEILNQKINNIISFLTTLTGILDESTVTQILETYGYQKEIHHE